jgi:4-amino-4-deoxy-L-arabinose transferase-like glycosyltransferase
MINKITKTEIFLGLVILFAALFLRIYNLNSFPVFGDEAIYIHWAQTMWKDANLRFLPMSDGKQPLFMWIMIPFLKIISDPLIAGRMVSVLSGIGTMFGTALLTHLLFKSKKISLLVALIYSLSPFTVFFDRLSLADSLLTMFGVWTYTLSYIAVKNKRFDFSMLAGFSLGGAILTKSPAIFFSILLVAVVILTWNIKKVKPNIANLISPIIYLIPTYLIGYGLGNILRLGPQFHMLSIRNKDYVYPFTHVLTSPLDPLLPFLDRSLEYFWILGPSVLTALIMLGVYNGVKFFRKETIILACWALLPLFAVAEFQRVLTARYIYFTLPYFFITASLVGVTVFEKHKGSLNKYLNSIIGLILIIFVMLSVVSDYFLITNPSKASLPRTERSGYLEEWTAGHGLKEVSEYLISNYGNTKEVHVGTEGYFGSLPDGIQIYLQNYPNIKVYGVGLDFSSVPDDLASQAKSGIDTFFVVNSDRLKFDFEKDPGLTVVKSYPKAVRPDGTFQSLHFFKLN